MSAIGRQLHEAVRNNDVKVLTSALKDPSFTKTDLSFSEDERTPFYNAARLGHLDCVKVLLAAGSDINKKYRAGFTAISAAVKTEHDDVAAFLYKNGADPFIKNDQSDRKNAFDYARIRQNKKMIFLFTRTARENPYAPDQILLGHDYCGHMVEEVYDFQNMSRISFLIDDNGQKTSFVRDYFKDIQGDKNLRLAFNKHAEKGGTAKEHEVFVDEIFKSTPQKTLGKKNTQNIP